jgi:hypothetical protein
MNPNSMEARRITVFMLISCVRIVISRIKLEKRGMIEEDKLRGILA